MNNTIYKTMLGITFADVIAEVKWRYPGLNMKTASKEFIELMAVVIKHLPENESKGKASVKIILAYLIYEAFLPERRN